MIIFNNRVLKSSKWLVHQLITLWIALLHCCFAVSCIRSGGLIHKKFIVFKHFICFNDPVSRNEWWAVVCAHYGTIWCLLCDVYTVSHKWAIRGGKVESLFHLKTWIHEMESVEGSCRNKDIWHVLWYFFNLHYTTVTSACTEVFKSFRFGDKRGHFEFQRLVCLKQRWY